MYVSDDIQNISACNVSVSIISMIYNLKYNKC